MITEWLKKSKDGVWETSVHATHATVDKIPGVLDISAVSDLILTTF